MKYILKNKKVIKVDDALRWGKWFETADRRVEQTLLESGKWISTVFLGLDHGWGTGKPLVFETMVFKSKEELNELDVNRYSTWKEATKGHKEMVKKWINK